MAQSISIRGSIIGGSSLCASSQGVSQCVRQLALAGSCGDEGLSYSSMVDTSTSVATAGVIGDAFEELDVLGDLSAIEFLYVKSSAQVRLRIDARPSTTQALLGVYPTLFAGGEVVTWTLDELPAMTVTFDVADQSVEQCAARFNAAAALAGAPTPRVTVVGGQLLFTSAVASPDPTESLNTFAGAAPVLASLGLTAPTVTPGKGGDVDVQGLVLLQFPRSPNAPVRIDVSGNATLEIIAAGRPV